MGGGADTAAGGGACGHTDCVVRQTIVHHCYPFLYLLVQKPSHVSFRHNISMATNNGMKNFPSDECGTGLYLKHKLVCKYTNI